MRCLKTNSTYHITNNSKIKLLSSDRFKLEAYIKKKLKKNKLL